MRKNYILLLLLVLLFSFNSCHKSDKISLIETSDPVSADLLSKTKTWYNLQNKLDGSINKLKPDWSNVKVKSLSNGRRLIIVATPDFKLSNKKMGFLRKTIFEEKEGQIISGNIVEFFGSPEYLADSENQLISQRNETYIRDFTGSIITYNISYNYLEGNTYKAGQRGGRAQVSFSGNVANNRIASTLTTGREQECYNVYGVTYWNDGTETWDFLYSYCITTDDPGSGGSGSGPGGSGGRLQQALQAAFSDNDIYIRNGEKPLEEFEEKCPGVLGTWNRSTTNSKEVVSLLTRDNKVMTVAMLSYTGGTWGGLYTYEGVTYYTYPERLGAPALQYEGMVKAAGQYFIPIRATIHTHNPCVDDGTDGISNQDLSYGDKQMADKFKNIVHYIIGCGAVGEFKTGNTSANVLATGSLSTTCSSIR